MTELVPGTSTLVELFAGLTEDERLDLLDEVNEADAREDRPLNTRLAYASDWNAWTKFCQVLGISPLTARSGLFRTFVKHLEADAYAPATIQRRLAGVITTLRDNGFVIPEKGGPTAAAWQRIATYEAALRARNEVLGRGKAKPFLPRHIRQACERLPLGLFGLRDKAIMLLGYAIAARQSETAHLLGGDIAVEPRGRGLEIHVRHTKGGRQRIVPVAYAQDQSVCPVRTWFEWSDAAGVVPDGPAICQLRGTLSRNVVACPDEPISPPLVTERIKQIGHTLLVVSEHFTGQSLRAGRVTALFDAGADPADICMITGHSPKSGTVYDYRRPEERWANNATALGL